jgi:hypothetical protein
MGYVWGIQQAKFLLSTLESWGKKRRRRLSGGFVSFATRVFVAFEGGFEN